MISFSVKTTDGRESLGIALSPNDIEALLTGRSVTLNIESARLGIWYKDDGRRVFLQPRDSKVLLVPAESKEEIGERLGLK